MAESALGQDLVLAGLGAMKAVAMANGKFDAAERDLLTAAAELFEADVDLDQLRVVGADALAAKVAEPLWRQRLVQGLVVMALIDGEASPSEVELIRNYATALGVKDPRVKNLQQLLDGKLLHLRLDVLRRLPPGQKMVRQAFEQKGVGGAFEIARMALAGEAPRDPELAWKFKSLGLLPEGTLGRAFWTHMTRNRFAFPGEPGGVPVAGVHHDLLHVLAQFDTDPVGETQIACFYAGLLKEDPFAFVFFVLLMFHLGVKISPIATVATGKFDARLAWRALQRGAALNFDPTENWDFWADTALPLDEVRQKYNVLLS